MTYGVSTLANNDTALCGCQEAFWAVVATLVLQVEMLGQCMDFLTLSSRQWNRQVELRWIRSQKLSKTTLVGSKTENTDGLSCPDEESLCWPQILINLITDLVKIDNNWTYCDSLLAKMSIVWNLKKKNLLSCEHVRFNLQLKLFKQTSCFLLNN